MLAGRVPGGGQAVQGFFQGDPSAADPALDGSLGKIKKPGDFIIPFLLHAVHEQGDALLIRQASEGEAQAVANVLAQLHDEDTDIYVAVRYVESLKAMADGNATKIFMPTELSGIASATGMVGDLFANGRVAPQAKAPPRRCRS